MAKKVGLVTLHGMGQYDSQYFAPLTRELQKKMGDRWDSVSFQPVNYANIFQGNEDKYWAKVQSVAGRSAWEAIRKFFLVAFADATSFEFSGRRGTAEYLATMKEIRRAVRAVYSDSENENGIPIVLVAHSLGCEVVSSYIWDAQKASLPGLGGDPLEDYLALSTMTDFVTFGCNIPLFIGGLRAVENFKSPNSEFKWTNYYEADDVLGWPLAPLSVLNTNFANVTDIELESKNVITGWNPAVHGEYWSNSTVIGKIFESLTSRLG